MRERAFQSTLLPRAISIDVDPLSMIADPRTVQELQHPLMERFLARQLKHTLNDLAELNELNESWSPEKWQAWGDRVDMFGGRKITEIIGPKQPVFEISTEFALPGMDYNGGLGALDRDHFLEAVALHQPGDFIGLIYGQRVHQVIRSNDTQMWQDTVTEPLPTPESIGGKEETEFNVYVHGKKRTVYRYPIGNEVTRLHGIKVDREVYPDDPNSDARLEHLTILGFGSQQIIEKERELGLVEGAPPYHLNESATVISALAFLDSRIRYYISEGFNPQEAVENALPDVINVSYLTNHTLIPAANGSFTADQVERYIKNNLKADVTKQWLDEFISQRNQAEPDPNKRKLNLLDLAMRFAGTVNGVSAFHSQTATESFRAKYGDEHNEYYHKSVEFKNATNGIFMRNWNRPVFDLWQKHGLIDGFGMPLYISKAEKQQFDERIQAIDREEMIRIKHEAVQQFRKYLLEGNKLDQFGEIVDLPEDVVLIGDARRFAGYKRRTMMFEDKDRLRQMLLDNPKAHIIIAGKAHPDDGPAKDDLAYVLNQIKDNSLFRERIHFIVDYDVELARHLDPAIHVWMNTPVVGLEACGTSGMKTGMLATQVSTRDGFYREMEEGAFYEINGNSHAEEVGSYYSQMEKAIEEAHNHPLQWAESVKKLWKGGEIRIASGSRMLKDYMMLYKQFTPINTKEDKKEDEKVMVY